MFKFSLSLIDYISVVSAEIFNDYVYSTEGECCKNASDLMKELDKLDEAKKFEIIAHKEGDNVELVCTVTKVRSIYWVKFDLLKDDKYYDYDHMRDYTSKEKLLYNREEILKCYYSIHHASKKVDLLKMIP